MKLQLINKLFSLNLNGSVKDKIIGPLTDLFRAIKVTVKKKS